jgi:Na+(H+)/acetate symporter ActP
MELIRRLALAAVVGVFVYLICQLVGSLLADLRVSFAVTIGSWLVTYAGALGLLAALWYFLAGGWISLPRLGPPPP